MLAPLAAGIAGTLISQSLLYKLKDKKINTIKKSYGEKRIDRAESLVNKLATSNGLIKGINFSVMNRSGINQATLNGLKEHEIRKISNALMSGQMTIKDIEKELKKEARLG